MFHAQAQAEAVSGPKFEVASVKPFGAGGHGGRPSLDTEQFSWPGVALSNLIAQAYAVNSDLVTGPDWLGTEMYSVEGKIPAGAAEEEFGTMLQDLLTERFRLTLHHETRVIDGYDLVVARGGPKLKASAAADKGGRGQFGPDDATLTYNKATVSFFATMLMMRIRAGDLSENPGERPALVRVVDKTGLTGIYDIQLHYSLHGGDSPGEDIFGAVESQLGLNLKPTRVSVDMVVVDHAEKTPTGN
jgi:uncharacterized protein (TIGR03435 family)